jgi:hypothetical protein|tara:strand:- start:1338 stop:1541 length:204 start_codon:yes stop_codon:yes gene_type:complete
MREVKLRLMEQELEMLEELVQRINGESHLRLSRSAVATACFREGRPVVDQKWPSNPTKTDQNQKTAP